MGCLATVAPLRVTCAVGEGMDQSRDDFAKRVGALLQDHLAGQEAARGAVSLLAGGAAFELWLAFETRLILEVNRERLGLDEQCDHNGRRVPRYWIGNEYHKVDLGITDVWTDEWVAALEFKLIHNNKNWKHQVDGVWRDLFPDPGTPKATLKPSLGRLAVVGVVGKVYWEPGYPAQKPDLAAWQREMWAYLMPPEGEPYAGSVQCLWEGRAFPIRGDRWLVASDEARSFFRTYILAASSHGTEMARNHQRPAASPPSVDDP